VDRRRREVVVVVVPSRESGLPTLGVGVWSGRARAKTGVGRERAGKRGNGQHGEMEKVEK
jgi:hypothetical protein